MDDMSKLKIDKIIVINLGCYIGENSLCEIICVKSYEPV